MQKQIRIYLIILVGAIICNGFKASRISPKVHGIYTQNLTNDKEIWEHITRGTANYYVTLQFMQGEFYVCSRQEEKARHLFPTFREAYLYPLFFQFKKNNNEIYSGYDREIMLFVYASDWDANALNMLKRQLYPYRQMLTHRRNGATIGGKIRVVITNPHLNERLRNDPDCYFWIQGTLHDLNDDSPNVSIISISLKEINLKSSGRYTSADIKKVKALAAEVHSKGKKLRLEKVPYDSQLHNELKEAGVDYFNARSFYAVPQLVYKK